MVMNGNKSRENTNGVGSALINLKILISCYNIMKSMQFETNMLVYDICRIIQDRIMNEPLLYRGDPSEYGLFINDNSEPINSIWLDNGRTLNYYLLKNDDRSLQRTDKEMEEFSLCNIKQSNKISLSIIIFVCYSLVNLIQVILDHENMAAITK
ncbi:unnamed protein product [Didymodactylos carnosus]|uniref:Talin N-terminal F0 domain-containing protein n=1 Tax=Didymodactylos carnosus TaxID=1234261 RepID=A0A815TBX7_9BILA|nr:unnamed protein product [Didymodactylos carnosus]CAF4367295.1 unnamed protein product [Didymodactylos carnosus]